MKCFIALIFLVPVTYAEPNVLFGQTNLTMPFTPNFPTTVAGPLTQLQLPGGSILSFQQGSTFKLDDNGTISLANGSLRIGPAGNSALILNLPSGIVTVAPLTALTLTVKGDTTSGRVYHGSLTSHNRTFTSGEGFAFTTSTAHGTFTPAAAQAPSLVNLAAIEPAAGPQDSVALVPPSPVPHTDLTTARTVPLSFAFSPVTEQLAPETPTPTPSSEIIPQPQPEIINPTPAPVVEQPQPPVVSQPNPQHLPDPEPTPLPDPTPEQPQPEEPQPEPETPAPIPEIPTVPQPVPQPEPINEPELPLALPEIPTSSLRSNLYASFNMVPEGIRQPDNSNAIAGTFRLSSFLNGTQQLESTQSSAFGSAATGLQRGSAVQLDATSHGIISGLGRWVGGNLVAVTGNTLASIPNGTPQNPNSLYYVWGEKPTAIPVTGRITYNLFSATQPTYTSANGTASDATGSAFAGNLAIDFAPTYSGTIGTYHFNGVVTMPQTVASSDADTPAATTAMVYTFTTAPQGVPLTGTTFNNPGNLSVTAPANAIACPGNCTGTVNAAGFGSGMRDAGTLYAINPAGDVGITGAALFTAAP